jgi:tetraacyldisaccharide 4'-kinase
VKRPLLLPLVPLYAAGVAWKNRRAPRHVETLNDPVVSVGSLSAGGAGKTPFVLALGEALRRSGYGIDLLSRGYGRSSTQTVRVNPLGTAEEFGDEPLLLARRLACPVYIAQRRVEAGRMAELDRRLARSDRALSIHLLDDGFQHRQLARAVDVVLFTREDAQDVLLPAGNLREPLRAMRRADVVVVRRDEASAVLPVLAKVFGSTTQPPVWMIDRGHVFAEGRPSSKPFAFCGIARPGSFRGSLHAAGVAPAGFQALRDHVRYDPAVVDKLLRRARACGADGFVTTAKDAVKLTAPLRAALESMGPLAVADVHVSIEEEDRCVRELIALIEGRWRTAAMERHG